MALNAIATAPLLRGAMGGLLCRSLPPLAAAADGDDADAITEIIAADDSALLVNEVVSPGGTALHRAARRGNVKAVEALLKCSKTIDVNLRHGLINRSGSGKGKQTPLAAAIMAHKTATAKLLIADPRTTLTSERNPKPFRARRPQERPTQYAAASERHAFLNGQPILVFAANTGTAVDPKGVWEELPELIATLLADPRTSVDPDICRRALEKCCSSKNSADVVAVLMADPRSGITGQSVGDALREVQRSKARAAGY